MKDKEILDILKSCLLSVDNVSLNEIIEKGIDKNLANYGIQLCSYLKSKEFSK